MDFINAIVDKLKNEKRISDTSINVYIGNLKKLNGNKPFGDFSFLENVEDVLGKIGKYKETTKKNYLVSIVSVLSLFLNNATIKALHDKYYSLMMKKKNDIEQNYNGDMTQKQADNWINWTDVQQKFNELSDDVDSFYKKKVIDEAQYNILLTWVLLSLYVLIPPRRNKDYLLMYVVDEFKTDMDKNKNYYDIAKKRFIFNNYKTAKKYGRFDIAVPNKLAKVLKIYLKHRDTHLPVDDRNDKPLLIKYDGTSLVRSNDITKLLNKVFGKNIGSSMLRHIFLTDKYGDLFKESEADSQAMAHSLDEQRNYVKNKLAVKV